MIRSYGSYRMSVSVEVCLQFTVLLRNRVKEGPPNYLDCEWSFCPLGTIHCDSALFSGSDGEKGAWMRWSVEVVARTYVYCEVHCYTSSVRSNTSFS